MARLISLTVLMVLIVFLGITFYRVVAPFILPLFLAGVFALICQPLFLWLVEKTRGRTRLAAGLTTAAILTGLLAPLILGTFIASVQMYVLARDSLGNREWKDSVRTIRRELQIDHLVQRLLPYIRPKDEALPDRSPDGNETAQSSESTAQTDPSSPTASPPVPATNGAAVPVDSAEVDQLQTEMETQLKLALQSIAQRTMAAAGLAAAAVPGAAINILGALVWGIISGLMFVIALYYFLADGPVLLAAAEILVPVHVQYQRELRTQFASVVRAVVLATFFAALVQGMFTAGALSIVGMNHFMIFFILAMLASLIPPAGAWLVWSPCAAWLFYTGHWGAGLFLVIVGLGVIGTIDNLIRVYVLNTDAKLHPLLAFVSVLGGLQMMGLWGVFVGPIVASCLHALVQIFNMELKEFSKEKFGTFFPDLSDVDAEKLIASEPDAVRLSPAETAPIKSRDGTARAVTASKTQASTAKKSPQAKRTGGKRSKKRGRK